MQKQNIYRYSLESYNRIKTEYDLIQSRRAKGEIITKKELTSFYTRIQESFLRLFAIEHRADMREWARYINSLIISGYRETVPIL